MNDTHSQQHAKEEISDTPTFFAENQLDPSPDQQLTQLNYHGRISTVEKSFKDEEHIYVSTIFSFLYLDPQNDHYFYYRLNLREEINEILLISLNERSGLSQL